MGFPAHVSGASAEFCVMLGDMCGRGGRNTGWKARVTGTEHGLVRPCHFLHCLTEGISIVRSKFMLAFITLALAAYVPACCCWLEAMSGWMVGATGQQCGHDCCERHAMRGGDQLGKHHLDRDHDDPDPRLPVPMGHFGECGCGVQYRIGAQPVLTVLDFAPVVSAWQRFQVECGPGGGVQWSGAVAASDERGACIGGERSLLRLHCALTV